MVSLVNYYANDTHRDLSTLDGARGIVMGVYCCVAGVLALVGNNMMFILVARFKALRTPTNLLLVNLAISDLAIAVVSFPLSAVSAFSHRWMFGESGCLLYSFLALTLGYASIGTLAVIAVDRYLTICKYDPDDEKRPRLYAILVAVVWGNSVFWGIMPLLGWGKLGLEPGNVACSISWWHNNAAFITYIVAVSIICIAFPFGVMAYCYLKAMRMIHFIGGDASQENILWTNEKDVTKMCLVCLFLFVLAWAPFALLCLWAAFSDPYKIPLNFSVVPPLLAKASTVYNPLVYVVTNRRYRAALACIFCCKAVPSHLQPPPGNSTTTVQSVA